MSMMTNTSYRFPPRAAVRCFYGVLLIAAAVLVPKTVPPVVWAQQAGGPRALVRRGLTVDGRIEGSVQQLSNEDTTLNGGGALTGDLLVPGTPTLRQSDAQAFGGVTQGGGGELPSDYEIVLNGDAQLGRLLTRVDAAAMPAVTAPPAPAGTRDVTLGAAGQSAGDFSTIRDLTLNAEAGMVTVPAGTYGALTANAGSAFVLGVAGSSQPAVYNLNSLKLNDGSQLQVVGPVVLTVAGGVTLDGVAGAETYPLWLSLKVAAASDVTLNGGGILYGSVTAPSGTVTINDKAVLTGGVVCDRLNVNGGALLRIVQ